MWATHVCHIANEQSHVICYYIKLERINVNIVFYTRHFILLHLGVSSPWIENLYETFCSLSRYSIYYQSFLWVSKQFLAVLDTKMFLLVPVIEVFCLSCLKLIMNCILLSNQSNIGDYTEFFLQPLPFLSKIDICFIRGVSLIIKCRTLKESVWGSSQDIWTPGYLMLILTIKKIYKIDSNNNKKIISQKFSVIKNCIL